MIKYLKSEDAARQRRSLSGIPLTLLASLVVFLATVLLTIDLVALVRSDRSSADVWFAVAALYAPAYFLILGTVTYFMNRYGFFLRQQHAADIPVANTAEFYKDGLPELVILVPSYQEEPEVIRKTLMAAALLEYPRRRVVLLIDDSPRPSDATIEQKLTAARNLPVDLQTLFSAPARRLRSETNQLIDQQTMAADSVPFTARIAQLYNEAAAWLEQQADAFRVGKAGTFDHIDQFFHDQILVFPARAHRRRSAELADAVLTDEEVRCELRRLAGLFEVEFSSFERKRYANLSHAPNKAMNLNSYISLLGGAFHDQWTADGLCLQPCLHREPTLRIPDAKYILTLDADTLLLPDYALRLIHVAEKPENKDIAVIQTPYSAFPMAPDLLERVAGATTDIQYLSHQGMMYFSAASWVGANAIIRHCALRDIRTEIVERGHRIALFVKDWTTIEDTAATIDLLRKGWKLYNYPARLAYSATPADFGALLIQRRRWSNGGLLLLPNLLRYVFQGPTTFTKCQEGLIRSYYLVSTGIVSVAMFIMIFCRLDDSLFSVWLPVAAAPYQLVYGFDLILVGYRWVDLPRAYALNMLLVPVQLGGNLQSLRQAVSRRKPAFIRTPKIAGRTAVPPLYIFSLYAILFVCLTACLDDLLAGRTYHLIFTLLNSAAYFYGLCYLVGFRPACQDVQVHLRHAWRRVGGEGVNGEERGHDLAGSDVSPPQQIPIPPFEPARLQVVANSRI